MVDISSIAASGSSTVMQAKAQNVQKAMAAKLIQGLEQASQTIQASAPNRVDRVQISPQAQALYQAEQGG